MPLTKEQRRHLERRLREERERALGELARYDERRTATSQEAAGDISKVPLHPADLGTDEIDQQIDSQVASRLSRELEEIDAALDRLYREPDRFGRDERTGEEIPFARLDVVPWARTGIARPGQPEEIGRRGDAPAADAR